MLATKEIAGIQRNIKRAPVFDTEKEIAMWEKP
jgi:hypothetical protein